MRGTSVLTAGAIDKLSYLWIKLFDFINRIDKVNWPPERVLKSWRFERFPFCRNVSLRNSLQWPIYPIKIVEKTKLFSNTFQSLQNQSVNTPQRKSTHSICYFLFIFYFFPGITKVGVRRENDETTKSCCFIKSNELLSNYYSRRHQNLRLKNICKITFMSLYIGII